LGAKRPGHRPRKVRIERLRELLVPAPKNRCRPAWCAAPGGGKVQGNLQGRLCFWNKVIAHHPLAARVGRSPHFPRPWFERKYERERQAFLERRHGW